jgi:hypothetical protein
MLSNLASFAFLTLVRVFTNHPHLAQGFPLYVCQSLIYKQLVDRIQVRMMHGAEVLRKARTRAEGDNIHHFQAIAQA